MRQYPFTEDREKRSKDIWQKQQVLSVIVMVVSVVLLLTVVLSLPSREALSSSSYGWLLIFPLVAGLIAAVYAMRATMALERGETHPKIMKEILEESEATRGSR